MKVILLEDVYKHGVAGEVVNVAPGYGRNYLLPRRLAVKATPGLMRQYENLRKQADMRRAERQKEYHALAEQIGQLELLFGMKAGEGGKLYGSVPSSISIILPRMYLYGVQMNSGECRTPSHRAPPALSAAGPRLTSAPGPADNRDGSLTGGLHAAL